MSRGDEYLFDDAKAPSRGHRFVANIYSLFALLVTVALLVGCTESPENQLMTAATRNDLTKVDELLNAGVPVNYRTPITGESPLTAAAASNHVAMVRLLLRRGADPNLGTFINETALLSAASHGYDEVVAALLDAGASANAAETEYGYTPLASAARNGQGRAVAMLLNAGADPDLRIKDGRSASALARHYGHFEIERILNSSATPKHGLPPTTDKEDSNAKLPEDH